jgi:hypothetical protein
LEFSFLNIVEVPAHETNEHEKVSIYKKQRCMEHIKSKRANILAHYKLTWQRVSTKRALIIRRGRTTGRNPNRLPLPTNHRRRHYRSRNHDRLSDNHGTRGANNWSHRQRDIVQRINIFVAALGSGRRMLSDKKTCHSQIIRRSEGLHIFLSRRETSKNPDAGLHCLSRERLNEGTRMPKGCISRMNVRRHKVFLKILPRVRFMSNTMKKLHSFMSVEKVKKPGILLARVRLQVEKEMHLMRSQRFPFSKEIEHIQSR